MDKEQYIHMVKFVIGSMLDLQNDKECHQGKYSFVSDLDNYTETIMKEGILDLKEFTDLVLVVIQEKGIDNKFLNYVPY